MQTKEFSYKLPPELIAQKPITPRDHSKLFTYDTKANSKQHLQFFDIEKLLKPGDVLVFNNSKVFPARLFGQKKTGGKIEILLLESQNKNTWTALLKPGKNMLGQRIIFNEKLVAEVLSRDEEVFVLEFNLSGAKLDRVIDKIGVAPTPPYIKNAPKDLGRYQTVYAKHRGSVAAPTAGFHFTENLLEKLTAKNIQTEYVTLHVGLGTFQPVKEDKVEEHKIHTEKYSVTERAWQKLQTAKQEGRRIIAVGTTSCRVLETVAQNNRADTQVRPYTLSGETDLYILPGYKYKLVDALITNFHLPESTLLMLVAAFIEQKNPARGTEIMKNLYREAIQRQYRFYSFGDAMFIS